MKKVHIIAASVFVLSMVHWVMLLFELHAIEEWTEREGLRILAAFTWQIAVIIGTVPSIIALGSGVFSHVLPSSAPPEFQRTAIGERSAIAAVFVLYLGMAPLFRSSSVFGYYLLVALSLILPLGLVAFICRVNRQPSWAPGFTVSVTWSGFFLAIIALAAIAVLNSILRSLIPGFGERTAETAYEGIAAATLSHYPFRLIIVSLSSVAEELIFRGFLLSQIYRQTRSVTAALLGSSFLFGLIHLRYGWYGAFEVGMYGICFGVVALWRRNLFPAILAHVWLSLLIVSAHGVGMAGYPW